MKSVYKNLVSFESAVDTALREFEPITETEICNLFDSVGRILAENVYAPRNNPPFNRATMDGFAVHHDSIRTASEDSPVRLHITGDSFIGESRKELKGAKNCFRISTGAIVPTGADAVVKVENTSEVEGFVEIYESVTQAENIAESGSDISTNELLLAKGKELETHDIAVLASLGIPEVEVLRRLNIQVISTGNELIGYDHPYSEGKINDANGVVVASELSSFQCMNAKYSGIVKDEYDLIRNSIDSALRDNDVVILSGGSSAGESDLVYRIIEEFNPGMIFHGVLVKPGLPTVFGKSGNKLLIGLPGFPVSALMIFRSIFLIPLLRSAGSSRIPSLRTGKLAVNLRLEMGRQNLIPVSMSSKDVPKIYPVTGLSGSITRFVSTSGFISVPGNTKFIEEGNKVDVVTWNNEIQRGIKMFSGIFHRGISDLYLSGKSSWEYARMLPRDSLKSLANGDTDISVFLATSDTDLKKYVSDEVGQHEFIIYGGNKIMLSIGTSDKNDDATEFLKSYEVRNSFTGPSLRMLKNIVNGSEKLKHAISGIEASLTSYSATDLRNAAESTSKGDYDICITTEEFAAENGLNSYSICEIRPVYVFLKDNGEKASDFLNINSLNKL